jgi:cytochrome P450
VTARATLAIAAAPDDARRMEPQQAFGALFNPLSEARADPYPYYAALREAAAVIRTPLGSLMATRYELVDRVLRSSAFRTPRGYRDPDDPMGPSRFDPAGVLSRHRRLWLLFQSGDAHTRLRKLIMKVFTPRAVRTLGPRIDALVTTLLDPIVERGSMQVIRELAYPLPATVICELLGIPDADRDRNRAWAAALAPTVDVMASDADIGVAEAAIAEWDGYLRDLVAERRRRPGEALLDAMLAAEDDGATFTEDEVVANATFLFLAGHETTTHLIGNGLLALLRHPDQLAALRAEPALIEGAVEELLRFDSPLQITGRVALEHAELGGLAVEPGIIVSLALGAANRDPRRYDRPDELDVRRRDVRPLSFGGGAHYCVGAALARLETTIAFTRLIGRSRDLALITTEPRWRRTLTLRGLEELEVAVRA